MSQVLSRNALRVLIVAFFFLAFSEQSKAAPVLAPIEHPATASCMTSYLEAYRRLPNNPWKDYYYNPKTGEKRISISISLDLGKKSPNWIYYEDLDCQNQPFMTMSDDQAIAYFQQLVDRFKAPEVTTVINSLNSRYGQEVYDTKIALESLLERIEKIEYKISSKRFLLKGSKNKKRKKALRRQIASLSKKKTNLSPRVGVHRRKINALQVIYGSELVPLASTRGPGRINLIREFSGAYPLIIIYRLSKGTVEDWKNFSKKISDELLEGLIEISFYAPGGPLTVEIKEGTTVSSKSVTPGSTSKDNLPKAFRQLFKTKDFS